MDHSSRYRYEDLTSQFWGVLDGGGFTPPDWFCGTVLSGRCPFPLREMTGRGQMGGGTYQEVLWCVSTPPLEFSTPFAALWGKFPETKESPKDPSSVLKRYGAGNCSFLQ